MKKLTVLLLLCIAFAGCKKLPGDKARVISVDPITINGNQWLYNAGNDNYTYTWTVADVTQNVVDNGSVSVYTQGNDGAWYALPVAIGAENYVFSYSISAGKINLLWYNTDGSTIIYIPNDNTKFKATIITNSKK